MGLFDSIEAQTPQGEMLRSGLLNAGIGMLAGSTGHYGQFAPALAMGAQGFQGGMQNAQKMQIMQAKLARQQQMQQMQMALAGSFSGGGQTAQGGQVVQGGANPVQGGANSGPSYQQLMQAVALGIPGAKDLLDSKLSLQKGITRKGGDFTINPMTGQREYTPNLGEGMTMTNQGQVINSPGYVGAMAQTAGANTAATEGAKSQYDLVDVVDPSTGDTVSIPKSVLLAQSGAGGGQAGGSQDVQPMGSQPGQTPQQGEQQQGDQKYIKSLNPTTKLARSKLGGMYDSAKSMIDTIDSIKNDPSLGDALGFNSMIFTMPGSDTNRVEAKLAQLKGKLFMDAYQMLKGGGPITDVEGDKATAAKARIDNAQNKTDFLEGLAELEDAMKGGLSAMYGAARMPVPKSAQKLMGDFYTGPDGTQDKPAGGATGGAAPDAYSQYFGG